MLNIFDGLFTFNSPKQPTGGGMGGLMTADGQKGITVQFQSLLQSFFSGKMPAQKLDGMILKGEMETGNLALGPKKTGKDTIVTSDVQGSSKSDKKVSDSGIDNHIAPTFQFQRSDRQGKVIDKLKSSDIPHGVMTGKGDHHNVIGENNHILDSLSNIVVNEKTVQDPHAQTSLQLPKIWAMNDKKFVFGEGTKNFSVKDSQIQTKDTPILMKNMGPWKPDLHNQVAGKTLKVIGKKNLTANPFAGVSKGDEKQDAHEGRIGTGLNVVNEKGSQTISIQTPHRSYLGSPSPFKVQMKILKPSDALRPEDRAVQGFRAGDETSPSNLQKEDIKNPFTQNQNYGIQAKRSVLNVKPSHSPFSGHRHESISQNFLVAQGEQLLNSGGDGMGDESGANSEFAGKHTFKQQILTQKTGNTAIGERPSFPSNTMMHLTANKSKTASSPPFSNSVMNQIVNSMTRTFREGRSRVSLMLQPRELGRLRMELISKNGLLEAKFFVESEEVRLMVENTVAELKEGLAKAGIQVENFEVHVDQEFSHLANHGDKLNKGPDPETKNTDVDPEAHEEDAIPKMRYFGYNSMEVLA